MFKGWGVTSFVGGFGGTPGHHFLSTVCFWGCNSIFVFVGTCNSDSLPWHPRHRDEGWNITSVVGCTVPLNVHDAAKKHDGAHCPTDLTRWWKCKRRCPSHSQCLFPPNHSQILVLQTNAIANIICWKTWETIPPKLMTCMCGDSGWHRLQWHPRMVPH